MNKFVAPRGINHLLLNVRDIEESHRFRLDIPKATLVYARNGSEVCIGGFEKQTFPPEINKMLLSWASIGPLAAVPSYVLICTQCALNPSVVVHLLIA